MREKIEFMVMGTAQDDEVPAELIYEPETGAYEITLDGRAICSGEWDIFVAVMKRALELWDAD